MQEVGTSRLLFEEVSGEKLLLSEEAEQLKLVLKREIQKLEAELRAKVRGRNGHNFIWIKGVCKLFVK